MGETATKVATYQDLIDAPEHLVAEILNGQLVTHPRPAPKHALAASSLSVELISPFQKGKDGPGGWVILLEPELHLGTQVCVPDLAGWRRETMPELPETAFFETPPDWICEVLSPSTARYDRVEKRQIYADFKILHLWHIDPVLQTLEAFELRDTEWVLLASLAQDDKVTVAPFAEVPFSLQTLWSY